MSSRKFQVVNEQGTITVPKDLWTAKKWKHGTQLEFNFGPKGEIIIEEAKIA